MIQDFFRIFITIILYFGYAYSVANFCKKYLEISRINKNLFFLFYLCGKLLVIIINRLYFIPNIFNDLFDHMFFILLVILLFKNEIEKKILAVSILITITTLIENFFVSFFSYFILFWRHTIKNISIPFLKESEINIIAYISLIIVILVIFWISAYMTSVFYCKTVKWYIISAIPLFAVTMVIDIANWGASIGILVRSNGNMGLYYDQIFSYMEFCILTLLSMFASGFYLFGMNKIYTEQEKSNQYHLQIMSYKMLEEQYSQSERLRHDLKNHVIALSGLLEKRELEKIEKYLNNMEDCAGFEEGEEITGNRIADVILFQKRKAAEKKNIIWECDVKIPKTCDINEFDLCVLFGNMLDNALEACERLKYNNLYLGHKQFISIKSDVIKNFFLLEVKNSTDITDKYKIGFTSKKNYTKHGIGLLNISDVVHRYNGTMDIKIHDYTFIITVLIPLNNSIHDNKQTV